MIKQLHSIAFRAFHDLLFGKLQGANISREISRPTYSRAPKVDGIEDILKYVRYDAMRRHIHKAFLPVGTVGAAIVLAIAIFRSF